MNENLLYYTQHLTERFKENGENIKIAEILARADEQAALATYQAI